MAEPTAPTTDDPDLDRRIRRALLGARLSGAFEAVWRAAIVPVWLAGLLIGLVWLGLRDLLPGPAGAAIVWAIAALSGAAAIRAALRLRRDLAAAWARPTALGRVERATGLADRALSALDDHLADPEAPPTTRALWAAHRRRAAAAIGRLRVGAPRPDLPRRDRLALRPALGLLLFVAWFAAGDERAARLAGAFAPGFPAVPADRLDAWVEPPAHTGLPPRALLIDGRADAETVVVATPVGSRLVLRASPGAGDRRAGAIEATATPAASLTAEAPDAQSGRAAAGEAGRTDAGRAETGRAEAAPGATLERRYTIAAAGRAVVGHEGRPILTLRLEPSADRPPTIDFSEAPSQRGRGGLRLGYEIDDDWGVTSATARIVPTGPGGHALYEPPSLPLALPAGARHLGRAETVRDLTGHPFAGAEVAVEATVVDGAGQSGHGATAAFRLPERPFRDPVARALVDLRRRLALDGRTIDAVAIALDALTLAPERFGARAGRHLGLRHLAATASAARDERDLRGLVEALWAAALVQEAGDTLDEEKALQAARDALAEALRSGASAEEIARLTQELRAAMNRYLEALTRAARNDPGRERAEGRSRRIDGQTLSRMVDRIEDLGRTGSREAAERLLSELGDTLDALRGARPGEAGGGEAQRALGDMIRRQRDLKDRTHRADRDGADAGERERLLGDQNGLRDELRRLRERLGEAGGRPPRGGEPGEEPSGESGGGANGEAGDGGPLGEADRAMDEAGRAIDRDAGGEAVDAQGRALDGLRRGARQLARGRGESGREAGGGRGDDGGEDPFGRPGRSRTPDGAAVGIPDRFEVERARRILDDIRRRLGDPGRPSEERDYLDRLMKLD
jgi:uncharacterized protein (TIGR02302 family)